MENQKALDSVWDYFLIAENHAGMDNGECLLWTPEGYRCALGCLPLYMEDQKAKETFLEDFKCNPEMSVRAVATDMGLDEEFAVELQKAHDCAATLGEDTPQMFRSDLQKRLTLIAEKHELTIQGDEP